VLADCPEFRIRKFEFRVGESLTIAEEEEPKIVSVIDGRLTVGGREETILDKGDNAVLPWAGAFELQAPEGATFLLTDRFAK
jgi:mannose-6-phosphate isomerase